MSSNLQVRAGFRRVPRRKESPLISPSQRYRARKYAHAHGYEGREGGWIYRSDGQHICHGWGWFYHIFTKSIEDWYTQTKIK